MSIRPRRNPTPVRFNELEKDLITQAASHLGVSLSEFMRISAVQKAKSIIAKKEKQDQLL